ncbi:MAG: hypothetical protein ABW352_11095 [Polyangiales bacterium]
MKRLAWTSLLLIVGCDMGRPYGSYMPRQTDDESARDAGTRDADDDGDEGPSTGVVIPPRGGDDAPGPDQPPPDSPLAAYAGTYLMRMDMYSALSTSVATTKLAVNNRISNFILAKIGVEDDRLVSQETFCHQTYAHNCTSGCVDGWRTTPDKGLAVVFPRSQAGRSYRIDGDVLVGEQSVFALGFEDENVSETTVLPKDMNDARLWKLESGGVGLVTRLQTKVTAFGIMQTFDCEVSAVQLFGSSFEGGLGEPEAPLEGVRFKMDVPALAAAPLAAVGMPTAFCNTKAISEQEAEGSAGESYVRFRKTDIEDECPTVGVFEEQLPADPP